MPNKSSIPTDDRSPDKKPLDANRFDQIHRQYWDRLRNTVAGLVRDRDKAEDVAAHAFEVAWEKREDFRGEASPATWIQAIARNDALESKRREQPARFDSLDRPDAREMATPGSVTDELEKQDDRARIKVALERLPPKHRRALVAQVVDGLSVRDIARREQVPTGTVLSRLHTARQLLRYAWDHPMTPGSKSEERQVDRREGNEGTQPSKEGRQERLESEPQVWDR